MEGGRGQARLGFSAQGRRGRPALPRSVVRRGLRGGAAGAAGSAAGAGLPLLRCGEPVLPLPLQCLAHPVVGDVSK